jgi:hypothetical protein
MIPDSVLISGTSLLMIGVGYISIFFGYLVKYGRMGEIVTGPYAQRIKDKEGFAGWVGGNVILSGISNLGFGFFGLLFYPYLGGIMTSGFILSPFVVAGRLLSGINKFI